jgi:flagellar hook assembly protein FlgD
MSDGTFIRQPYGTGNVWLFRNVFNPDNGERAGAVFRHGDGDKIRVRIFNKRAAFIKELARETTGPAGLQQVYWDGTNDRGAKVVSGIYIMLVETSTYKITEKIGVVH